MASIKTEPDSDGELYPTSHSDGHYIDMKEEVKAVLVSFLHRKTASDVGCLLFWLWLITCSRTEVLAVSVVSVYKLLIC